MLNVPTDLSGVTNVPWHAVSVEDSLVRLRSSVDGLSEEEATARLIAVGPNELTTTDGVSWSSILIDQFKNVLIIILLVGAALSFFLGHGIESVVIVVIVLFAAGLGFIQEYRAERAMTALMAMAAPTATVIREGREREVEARELTPGDLVVLGAGDNVPADARLIDAINLQADEASLTGESNAVSKQTATLSGPELGIGDQNNMVFAATIVTYGRGRAVVTATGMDTQMGRIAHLLQTVESGKTPLQQNLDRIGGTLARAALVVVLFIVALGVVRGPPRGDTGRSVIAPQERIRFNDRMLSPLPMSPGHRSRR